MSANILSNLLKVGEYEINKLEFTLTHDKQRKDSTGRKRRIEYRCDKCNHVYVTKLCNEIAKVYPWLCRSCRTKEYWQQNDYREAILSGITNETRIFRKKQRAESSLKMWANPQKREEISTKLRQRDPKIYSKAKRAMRSTIIVLHWKSGEELLCVGSYEVAFVNWCNQNKIDFDWQIPHKMPDGRVYIIDSFIKDGEFINTWIEIKGYLNANNGVGKAKWEWFHTEHPNDSLLWTQQNLRDLGILK